MTQTLSGRLVTHEGILRGMLVFDEAIEALYEARSLEAGKDPFILPGFIDSHVHGGGGGDTMDGPEGVRTLARFHLERGTTTLTPTTLTNPWDAVLAALEGVRTVRDEADPSLPSIVGVHLEGPFISPHRLGAQPPYTLEPDDKRLEQVLALGVVKLVTLAPELPGALAAATRFAEAGVRVSVGHTRASFEQTRQLIRAVENAGGVVGFTHLYNAMGGMEGRDPGVVGAALAHGSSYAELIYDRHHVHEGGLLAALAAKPRHLSLITDAIRATGQAEGKTELGGQTVTVKGGAARLADGTLAGSVLTLDQALRNTVAAGLDLSLVSRLLSATPAAYLGLHDRGTLSVGARADLVVLDEALEVQAVYLAGRKVVG